MRAARPPPRLALLHLPGPPAPTGLQTSRHPLSAPFSSSPPRGPLPPPCCGGCPCQGHSAEDPARRSALHPKAGDPHRLMEGGVFLTASWTPRSHPRGLCLPPASPPLQFHRGFYSGLHGPGAMNRAVFQESRCPLKPPWSCSYTLKDAFLRSPSVSLAWKRPRALDTPPGPTGTRPHARLAQPGPRVPGTLSGVCTGTDGDELSPVTLALGSLHAYAGSPSCPAPVELRSASRPLMVPPPPCAAACLTKDSEH